MVDSEVPHSSRRNEAHYKGVAQRSLNPNSLFRRNGHGAIHANVYRSGAQLPTLDLFDGVVKSRSALTEVPVAFFSDYASYQNGRHVELVPEEFPRLAGMQSLPISIN